MSSSSTGAECRKKKDYAVIPTTKVSDSFEVSAFRTPNILMRELEHVFSNISPKDSVIAILTCQHSATDLVKYDDEADVEKDNLLENFMKYAREFCNILTGQGFWADYIDPCSGLAMIDSNPNKVYSEVDGMQMLLKYKVMNAGCCKILLHPEWGSAVYPASIFTTAPEDVMRRAMEECAPYCENEK